MYHTIRKKEGKRHIHTHIHMPTDHIHKRHENPENLVTYEGNMARGQGQKENLY